MDVVKCRTLSLIFIVFLATVVTQTAAGRGAKGIGYVTPARLLAAASNHEEWITGGRDYQQSYYSPLSQIGTENIDKLGFAWEYPIDSVDRFEATPVVVDGVMFTSGNWGAVYAIDARSGDELWRFTPTIRANKNIGACCGPVNRGVAVWRGVVYVGSLDGYLYALQASSGKVLWAVDTIVDRERAYAVTGAPYICNELVVIGNSGADFDARGYVTAYDTKTGRQAWRFFTVPAAPNQSMEHAELDAAAKTWDPNSLWEVGLGGTAWDGMAFDPELNLLYVGTGNATPYPRRLRSPAGGDNLFLASVLAIDPRVGRLVWHYQTVPGENWDYTAVQKMIIADLEIGGRIRKVLMQAPKNGFFYVLDRQTGELLSAQPYVYVNWASRIDIESGRPVETSQGDYSIEPRVVFPSSHGGHGWQPMSYSGMTGLVYIPTIELSEIFAMPEEKFSYKKGQVNMGVIHVSPSRSNWDRFSSKSWPSLETLVSRGGRTDYTPRTFLRAWDPVRNQLAWEVETTNFGGGLDIPWSLDGSGVMSTGGGLVFQGRNVGEDDGWMAIYDAENGRLLRRLDVGGPIDAAAMSYAISGEQFVAFMSGRRGTGRIVALKIGGGEVPQRRSHRGGGRGSVTPPPTQRFGTEEEKRLGRKLYLEHCAACHAPSQGAPNLEAIGSDSYSDFGRIVLEGIRVAKGMPSFAGLLSEQDVRALKAFIIDSSWGQYERGK